MIKKIIKIQDIKISHLGTFKVAQVCWHLQEIEKDSSYMVGHRAQHLSVSGVGMQRVAKRGEKTLEIFYIPIQIVMTRVPEYIPVYHLGSTASHMPKYVSKSLVPEYSLEYLGTTLCT
jgi:hypothetical protein